MALNAELTAAVPSVSSQCHSWGYAAERIGGGMLRVTFDADGYVVAQFTMADPAPGQALSPFFTPTQAEFIDAVRVDGAAKPARLALLPRGPMAWHLYAPFLVTFDLADNTPAEIKARLGDADIDIYREDAGVWHLYKGNAEAHVQRLDTLGNGDTVFLFVMPVAARDYLINKLGANRVVPLLTAWNDPTVRAALGGVTAKAWLLARGFSEASGVPGTIDGSPVLPLPCFGAEGPIALAQRVFT